MKKTLLIVLVILFLPILSSGQEKKKAIYFYTETCPHCIRVNQFFSENGIYQKYDIKKIEASGKENFELLNQFFNAFGVEAKKRGYPVIFFDTKMIIGDQPIISNFLSEIEASDANSFPDPELIKKELAEANGGNSSNNSESIVSLPILISAALVDAINPCAFAVLIILVATVFAARGKKQAILSGLAFSMAIFISYFLMGLGIYKAIGIFNLPKIISIIVGVLAILIGLANLKDYFWHGKFFVMEVPMSWRPKMQAILKKVTSPIGALGAGILVSLFLLPCTSGPYLVILGLLVEREDMARTLSLLVLYNLVFVLPMIVITLAVGFGVRAKKFEEFRVKNIRLLHAIAGAIMLFIGVYLIYSWLK